VPFDIIPAIDVHGGRLARFVDDGVEREDAFEGDPVAAAEVFVLGGAKWLHVVDLELALTGRPANLQTISLLAVMDAHVQASGGVATEEQVEALLSAGAQRAVLGSAALADRALTERVVDRYGDAVAVALEVSGDTVAPRGRPDIALPLGETIDWLKEIGVARCVHVAVDRVGELAGPELEGASHAAFRIQRPVIVSGGIRGAADVQAVASLAPMVQGVILGRSLYEGALTVRDAIRAAALSGA
jgi:phosphoribosylformimino-5-aminoimidazole carboxamide ribonucleotide (ProFAR) isomerase